MGGSLLLALLLLPSLVVSDDTAETTTPTPPAPPSNPFSNLNVKDCQDCVIPPTIPGCGTPQNPRCRPPFSMPYKGQNHQATCARLRCPENYDMFVNTAASGREGARIIDFTPTRVVLNPQTIVCAPGDDNTYKFMIRDGQGFMRPVHDVQCQQNNFPRHSCVTDGFLRQTCTKEDKCTPISYLSDYGGNKCNEPFKLMMRFSDTVDWEPMKKLSCDRELGWWRVHFTNGTWMHTRYGTIATCVYRKPTYDPRENALWIAIKGVIMLLIIVITLAVSFNAYMTRATVVWEGSNWQRLWMQDLLEKTQVAENREMLQNMIVRDMRQQKWHEYYKDGLHMDLRQYDIMQNAEGDVAKDMRHWTMLDDFDYNAQREEQQESQA